MRWQNADGDRVDPVPFVVSSLLAIMIVFSFGPAYAMEYGFGLGTGLITSGVVTVATILAAYHRLVWHSRPEMRAEIPPELRLVRLFYAVIAGVLILSALTIPILLGR